MRLFILNGPNIDMTGKRNPGVYGSKTYKQICKELKGYAKSKNIRLNIYQSNSEEKIIKKVQLVYNKYKGFIINLGAFTHYSYAIGDALELCRNVVEVHFSNILEREEFRKVSVLEHVRCERFMGEGVDSYKKAIDFLSEKNV